MPLTDSVCRNVKPADKAQKLYDSGGLFLQVTPKGQKYWRLKYRFADKEKLLALGVYPTIPLIEARKKRDAAKDKLANGIDPALAKKDDKRKLRVKSENTFESIAREWHAHQKQHLTPSYWNSILTRLQADIFTQIGAYPIQDITAPQILDALRLIEKRGAHDIAKRSLQMCGQVFRYAIVTGRTDRNPATDLRGALKPARASHYAAITIKELPEFVKTLERNDARLYALTRLAIRFMMLTFVRTGELIKAQWHEIDEQNAVWEIPAERMKMRRPHIVPLSKQALAIIQELKTYKGAGDHLFPSQIKPRNHMSNNTILKALERMGYKGRMTGHGFRALAMSTIKEKLKYRHEVVDRQLAHAQRNKIDAAYDRAQFLDDRTIMMQEWADYLDSIA